MRRCEDVKMRRCEDVKVDYFCHRTEMKYSILHFPFSILHLDNVSGWEKEKTMNRQLRTRFDMAGGRHEQHEQREVSRFNNAY
jgi:hypothetical protein